MRILVLLSTCLLAGCGAKGTFSPSDRSWHTGTVSITPHWEQDRLRHEVCGRWPDGSHGLWIRYRYSMIQDGRPDVLVSAGAEQLFHLAGALDFRLKVTSTPKGSLSKVDLSKPFRAVLDYELWKGEPDKGELLAKNSVFSDLIRENNKEKLERHRGDPRE